MSAQRDIAKAGKLLEALADLLEKIRGEIPSPVRKSKLTLRQIGQRKRFAPQRIEKRKEEIRQKKEREKEAAHREKMRAVVEHRAEELARRRCKKRTLAGLCLAGGRTVEMHVHCDGPRGCPAAEMEENQKTEIQTPSADDTATP